MNKKLDAIEHKNVSALIFDFWKSKTISTVDFGAELKEVNSDTLIFALDELDKNIFLNYYNKLPIDGDKKFKLRLEWEE